MKSQKNMTQEVKRLVIPDFRFYITCIVNENGKLNLVEIFKSKIKGQSELLKAQYSYMDLVPFEYEELKYLGVLEIKLGEVNTSTQSKPSSVFDLSREIASVLPQINRKETGVLMDTINLHPYALVISSGFVGENILWNKEKIENYKKTLGSWVEYYSGQWEDYSDELYDERVANNLSNRLSELHYIRANSGFILMPREDSRWPNWMEYMEKYFVNQILLSRAVLFVIMLLNENIDAISQRFRSLPPDSLHLIEVELNQIEELNLSVNEITTALVQEKLMNRLHHSTKVVRRCFELYSLEAAENMLQGKIRNMETIIQKEHIKTQSKLQNQQKKYVMILNALIGSQVLFTLQEKVNEYIDSSAEYVLNIIVWIVMIFLIGFSVGGLLLSIMKSKTGFIKKSEVGR